MTTLTLHLLPPSPNNAKVMLAMKLKGLDHEVVEYHGFDGREALVEATGQPLTPVLIDGDRKVYDSFAIMRYLDANWPNEPRLFFDTRDEQRAVETWENFARNGLAPALVVALNAVFSGDDDPAPFATSERLTNELAVRIETALESSDYLVGGRISAADLTVATFLAPSVIDPESVPEASPVRAIASRVRLSGRFPRTHAWARGILAIGQEQPAV